jgi:hypothetical protein
VRAHAFRQSRCLERVPSFAAPHQSEILAAPDARSLRDGCELSRPPATAKVKIGRLRPRQPRRSRHPGRMSPPSPRSWPCGDKDALWAT